VYSVADAVLIESMRRMDHGRFRRDWKKAELLVILRERRMVVLY